MKDSCKAQVTGSVPKGSESTGIHAGRLLVLCALCVTGPGDGQRVTGIYAGFAV